MPRRKNLRKVPQDISEAVKAIDGPACQAAVVLVVSRQDIQSGAFNHVGLSVADGQIVAAPPSPPPPEMGKYSYRNIAGRKIVREDLPKVVKTIDMGQRPIYGDWDKGSFTLYVDREVYQRQFEEPRGMEIRSEVLRASSRDGTVTVKVSVLPCLDKGSESFEGDLLFQLNLLQENVGAIGVLAADATSEDLLSTQFVSWEILPPGERDKVLEAVLKGYRKRDDETVKRIVERLTFLESLKPIGYVVGMSGIRRYFGAKFADDLVVFENLDYGNAAYVMYDQWSELSKLSRTELLESPDANFDRVVHRGDSWKEQIRELVQRALRRRGRLAP